MAFCGHTLGREKTERSGARRRRLIPQRLLRAARKNLCDSGSSRGTRGLRRFRLAEVNASVGRQHYLMHCVNPAVWERPWMPRGRV